MTPGHARADEDFRVECSTEQRDGGFVVSIRLRDLPEDRIEESLSGGHAAEIRYRIRLMRPRGGLLSLPGDELEEEHVEVYTGMWNPVMERFGLRSAGGTRYFTDYERFFEAFTGVQLPVSATDLPGANDDNSDSGAGDGRYVLVRATVIPKVPVPPFTLLAPFMPGLKKTSPWFRIGSGQ
jgi:hypothetical protein